MSASCARFDLEVNLSNPNLVVASKKSLTFLATKGTKDELTRWTMLFLMLSGFISILLGGAVVSWARSDPSLTRTYFMAGAVSAAGKSYIRYTYAVFNHSLIPDTSFSGPDCRRAGVNTRASRTWVDVYDPKGKEIVWILRVWQHSGTWEIWFALEEGEIPTKLCLHRVKRSPSPTSTNPSC